MRKTMQDPMASLSCHPAACHDALLRVILSARCAFVRDDVSTFLRAALEAGESWDIVVLDPPKLAPNR